MRRAVVSDILVGCKSWQDVSRAAAALVDTKSQGDLFEALVAQYLRLDPVYQAIFDDVWLLHDLPSEVRRALDLGDGDIGIDIVCKTREGRYWAVQAKYRTDPHQPLSWKADLSTFAGLVAGRPFEQALVATTTIDISERSKQGLKGHFAFLKADVWSNLDGEFFARLSAQLGGRKAKLEPRDPRKHQRPAVRDVVRAFSRQASRAKLLMACGTGKTLTSFFIAEKMGSERVLIAVPNLGLARQILREWMRESVARGHRPRAMVVCSDKKVADDEDLDIEVTDLGVHVTTDVNEARDFLRSDGEFLVVTTYQSGETTASAARAAGVTFDLGIFDEAHKTVGHSGKSWSHLLFDKNIRISKRLFMTATERVFRNTPDDVELVDMDDVEHYGETAHSLTFLQALDKKLLCDYRVVTLETTTSKAERLLADRRFVLPKGFDRATRVEMLAAALELLDGMQQYSVRHVISYHSSVKRARFFEALIASLLRLPKYGGINLATFHLNGSDSAARRDDVMRQALAANYSVVTNCRCLTEGIDVPAIDGIAFVDAKGSKVDIVQAVGRALRRSDGKRFGYVFLPAVLRKGQDLKDLTSGPYAATAATISAMGTMDANIVAMVEAVSQGKPWTGARAVPFTMPVGVKVDPEEFGRGLAIRIHSRLSRRTWTRERVLRAIAERRSQGLPLNSNAVQEADSSLEHAARKFFGTWHEALRAAGMDAEAIRLRVDWSRERVVEAIKARLSRGLPVNSKAVQRTDSALDWAGRKFFGSWEDALRAAGVDVENMLGRRIRWTKESVLDAIRSRAKRGLKLNHGKAGSSLSQAAKKLFGSWDQALKAAGIDPNSVRRSRVWTKALVLERITQRRSKRQPLNVTALDDSGAGMLIRAATKLFGSWDEALRAAGVDPSEVRLRGSGVSWSKPLVVREIRKRKARGEPLNSRGIRQDEFGNQIFQSGSRLFGSWDAALRAAGLDPEQVKKRKAVWSRTEVLEAIRERQGRGLPLNQAANAALSMVAKRVFGSWDAALHAAGIDPLAVRRLKPTMTRREVARALKERAAAGLPVNARKLQEEGEYRLYKSAVIAFDTFDAALRAAGFDPKRVRPRFRGWDKGTVIAAIRARAKSGAPMNAAAVQSDKTGGSSLFVAAARLLGPWSEALEAAGLDAESVRRTRKPWTRADVVEELRRRHSLGQEMTSSAIARNGGGSLVGVSYRFFKSWGAALRAAGIDSKAISHR